MENKNEDSFLEQNGTNLTLKAQEGDLEKVFGREKETLQMVEILLKKKKNNIVLTGQAGVGKTSMINALIHYMNQNDAPPVLSHKEVYSIEVSNIMAGTKYRGQMEEKMIGILKEAADKGNVILFIDEIHNIMGSGSNDGMNIANVMKPYLTGSDIQVIGATTDKEYVKVFEKDSALVRRFHKFVVSEPSVKVCRDILKKCIHEYSRFHNVEFPDTILNEIPVLCKKYITERRLPDSAIDIIDELGAKKKINKFTGDEVVNKYIGELSNVEEIKKNISMCIVERKDFDHDMLSKAISDKDVFMDKLNERFTELENTKTVINEKDLYNIVSKMSGIPLDKLNQSGKEKVLDLKKDFDTNLIGQNNAVDKVLSVMKKSVVGFNNPNRPLGVFLFLGMTGTGKTYLAQILSNSWYDGNLIRIDMSEYSDKTATGKLIGANAGYVGYEEGGILTNKVRQNPYSVILFDEIEKAEKDVLNTLLQIFDNGMATDSQGREINFRNTIIIMTSNLGATDSNKKTISRGGGASKSLGDTSEKAAQKYFTPEFWNRIDHKIVFNKLDKNAIEEIFNIEMSKIVKLIENKNVGVNITDTFKKAVIEKGFSEKYGARFMKQEIEKNFTEPVTDFLFENENPEYITVDWNDEKGEILLSVAEFISLEKG